MMRKSIVLALILNSMFFISCSKSVAKVELFPVKSGDKWGFVDREGKIVINPQFAEASAFRDGLALVKSSGEKSGYGFIDASGKMIINPNYKSATVFNEDIAWVVLENAAPTAINDKGEVKFSLEKAQSVKLFHDGLAAFSVADTTGVESWGFVQKDGTIIIPNQFDEVGDYNEKKCAIMNKDSKWGYIDESGKIVINPQFESATKFKNGVAVVKLDDKAGVIDESGKYIINPQYSNIQIDEDMFLVELDDKWGWVDKTGKIIINPQFESASIFGSSDLAPVASAQKTGFIDKTGNFVINPQFDSASSFNNDLALVVASRKIGFIDEKGKYIVNPQFDEISADLIRYLNGEAQYESVQTDFFDIKSITNKVNFELPEGVNFDQNISSILDKLKFSSDNLNKYSEENAIITSKKASSDATYTFSLIGKPFLVDEYGYPSDFNPTSKIEGVKYKFYLSNKGAGKGLEIKKEFTNSLSKYTKVKAGFIGSAFMEVYKNSNRFVLLGGDEDSIVVTILNFNYDISSVLSMISTKEVSKEVQAEYNESPIDEPTGYKEADTLQ